MRDDYTTDDRRFRDFYQVLGVGRGCAFGPLKRAYFSRAKECHPDRFPGDPTKEREFRLLVEAFDVLSDPTKRAAYDGWIEAQGQAAAQATAFVFRDTRRQPIMDSFADDILEELIVGNTVPEDATLQTLMRDLERTEEFVRFREGRTQLAQKQYARALKTLKLCCRYSPGNILYRYYLALAAERLHRWRLARKHYRAAIRLGALRQPPQQLLRIRHRLARLRRKHGGLLGRLRTWLGDDLPMPARSAEEEMIAASERSMTRLLRDGHARGRNRGGGPARKQLPPGDH